MSRLSESGREEVALALILWKDFKAEGKMDVDIFITATKLADTLGVRKQFDALLPKIPPMRIEPR